MSNHSKNNELLNAALHSNLRDLVQKKLLKEMLKITVEKIHGWTILILDELATKILSYALKMTDLVDLGISIVEKLELKRQSFPEMPAIYFVSPTLNSIEKILQDFSNDKKLKYNHIHLFFTSHVPDSLFSLLKTNPILLNHIKTFKEVNIDFNAIEKCAFTLDLPDFFQQFYSPVILHPDQLPMDEMLKLISLRLVTVCATLHEYPYIRYNKNQKRMNMLAQIFQKQMNEFLSKNRQFQYHTERSTLLFMERNEDPLSPFIHEFTYQAMAYDILDIQSEKITYPAENNTGQIIEKTALLNENDPLWIEYRHTHIAEVSQQLSNKMKELSTSAGAALSRGNGNKMEVSQMAAALRDLPEYQDTLRKLSQHIYLASKMMEIMTAENMMKLPLMEQALATGVDENGKQLKENYLLRDMEKIISQDEITIQDKARLLAVFMITQDNIKEKDRKNLMNIAGITSTKYENAMIYLAKLGISLQKASTSTGNPTATGSLTNTVPNTNSILSPTASRMTSKDIKEAKSKAESCDYATMRYEPPLKLLTKKLSMNELPLDMYPFVIAPPPDHPVFNSKDKTKGTPTSMRKRAPSKFIKGKSEITEKDELKGERILLFMVGGATYSELRSMYELREKEKRDIIFGSTHFIRPNVYLEELATLENRKDMTKDNNEDGMRKPTGAAVIATESIEFKLSPPKSKNKK